MFGYDFMLLKLDCSLNASFYPELPTSPIGGGYEVHVAGWGRMYGNGELSSVY